MKRFCLKRVHSIFHLREAKMKGVERLLCARCARFSIAIAGNHKECLHDHVSFQDRQPNVSHQYPKSSLMSTACVRLPPGAWSNATVTRHMDSSH